MTVQYGRRRRHNSPVQGEALVLSMSIIGLLCGALVGGRVPDRLGKTVVLIIAVAILGLVLGLGMGGGLPRLISIAAEAVTARYRTLTVGGLELLLLLVAAVLLVQRSA